MDHLGRGGRRFAALPLRLTEHHRAGDSGVEALDAAVERDAKRRELTGGERRAHLAAVRALKATTSASSSLERALSAAADGEDGAGGSGGSEATKEAAADSAELDGTPWAPRPGAVALVMGCSSAKLEHHGDFGASESVVHTGAGCPLAYLDGGFDGVVGMLWDVTAKQLDLLTQKLVAGLASAEAETQMLALLPAARRACKPGCHYAVGAALVCFGLPPLPAAR